MNFSNLNRMFPKSNNTVTTNNNQMNNTVPQQQFRPATNYNAQNTASQQFNSRTSANGQQFRPANNYNNYNNPANFQGMPAQQSPSSFFSTEQLRQDVLKEAELERHAQDKLSNYVQKYLIVLDETAFTSQYSVKFIKHLKEAGGNAVIPESVRQNLNYLEQQNPSLQYQISQMRSLDNNNATTNVPGDVGTAVLNLLYSRYNVLLVSSNRQLITQLRDRISTANTITTFLSIEQINQYGYLSVVH